MTLVESTVTELTLRYGKERRQLLPILRGVYEKFHYLSDESMVEVARQLDISSAEVFGKVTFYSFLSGTPQGEFVIRICKTIVCDMKNKKQIVDTLENLLKIKMGQTTHNRKFSLCYTNCLGLCHKAPAMLINNEAYTDLTPDKVRQIIASYKNR